MWKTLVLASLICLSLGLAYSRPAHAAKSTEQLARDQVRRGTAAFNLGHFDEAVKAYEEAYRLVPDPSLLYNIAQSYRMDHKLEKAMIAYRSFLRNAGSDDPNRRLAERRVEDLQKQIDEENAAKAALEPPKASNFPEPKTKSPPIHAQEPAIAPTPDTPNLVDQPPPPPIRNASPPFYKKWWFWGAVGGAVAAGTVTAILLASGAKGQCAGESNDCLGVK